MGIGIREARETLPSLIKRAAFAEEDIAVGTRGSDEVTLVSTGKYVRLKDELKRLRAEVAALRKCVAGTAGGPTSVEARPFAGLQRALDAGALSGEPGVRTRRIVLEESANSSVSRQERIRLGSRGNHEPQYRRTRPRA